MNKLLELLQSDAINVINAVDLSELKNKRILLTGGSGLLGTHILETLFVLNNYYNYNTEVTAIIQSIPGSHLIEIFQEKNINSLIGDLTDPSFIEKIPCADYIIHSAGYAQPSKFMSNPVKTIQLNTYTTIELIRKLNIDGKFVYLSSSEVYSGLEKVPFSEDDIGTTNTDHARSCYIEGKRCGEAIINAYRQNGIKAKSIRLSLAYGPGTKKDDGRVMSNFIQKAINDKEISMLDDGSAIRTYCYISDVVEYIFQVLLNGKNNIYNVGGYSEITIAQLAQKIGTIYNIPIKFPSTNNEIKGSPSIVKIDMSRAESEFNKKEYVDFDSGLMKTIRWYEKLNESE